MAKKIRSETLALMAIKGFVAGDKESQTELTQLLAEGAISPNNQAKAVKELKEMKQDAAVKKLLDLGFQETASTGATAKPPPYKIGDTFEDEVDPTNRLRLDLTPYFDEGLMTCTLVYKERKKGKEAKGRLPVDTQASELQQVKVKTEKNRITITW